MSIPFTQYMRPNGRRADVTIDRPPEVEKVAHALIEKGVYFECEVLMTGHASITAGHPVAVETALGDIAIKVIVNDEGALIDAAVDEVVAMAAKWVEARGL